MLPKSTGLHKALKAKHNIHKHSSAKKEIVLNKTTTHNLKAGLKHKTKKANVGKKVAVKK